MKSIRRKSNKKSIKTPSIYGSHPLYHFDENIAGLQNILPEFGESTETEIYAKKTNLLAQVIKIDVQKLRRRALDNPDVMIRLWEALVPRLVYLFPEKFPLFKDMSAKEVKRFFFNRKNVEIGMLNAGQEINLPAGGILWKGEIEELGETRQQWKDKQLESPKGEKKIGVENVEDKFDMHASQVNEEDLRYTAIRLVVPEVSEKGSFGLNRFKVCADRTVVTVFHSELKPIWEKDSLHAINLFQVNGVRETGHRQLNTLQSTNNFFAHVPLRTPSYAKAEAGKSPLSKSGTFGSDASQPTAPILGRRASKSALFDPSFQT